MGRKPLHPVTKLLCFCCGEMMDDKNFYTTYSPFFENKKKAPVCKMCLGKLFDYYAKIYKKQGIIQADEFSIRRICMTLDVYFSQDYVNKARVAMQRSIKNTPKEQSTSDRKLINFYMKLNNLSQNKSKDYENTIEEEWKEISEQHKVTTIIKSIVEEKDEKIKKATQFFGEGFSDEDYEFLQKEYDDWTSRHECQTKAQEEIFKDICFNRLQNIKALREGKETKNIASSFQQMLDSGKLKPKQNKGDTISETQTFGTLIDKWENTRPLPEIDKELNDVDCIGRNYDAFVRGHTCKMVGVENAYSHLYSSELKKYTVNRPEYSDESDEEVIFDAIFGAGISKDEEGE